MTLEQLKAEGRAWQQQNSVQSQQAPTGTVTLEQLKAEGRAWLQQNPVQSSVQSQAPTGTMTLEQLKAEGRAWLQQNPIQPKQTVVTNPNWYDEYKARKEYENAIRTNNQMLSPALIQPQSWLEKQQEAYEAQQKEIRTNSMYSPALIAPEGWQESMAKQQKAQADADAERIAQLQAMIPGEAAAGNAETVKAMEEELAQLQQKQTQNQYSSGRGIDTVTGAAKQYASGFVNAVGDVAQLGGASEREEELARLNAELMNPDLSAEDRAQKQARVDYLNANPGTDNEVRQPQYYAAADRLAQSGAEDLSRAKEGLGAVGQTLVDVGAGVLQLGADVALGVLSHGGTMLPMAVRSYGGGSQEARQNGANLGQSVLAGSASALVEYLTEQISNVSLGKVITGPGGKKMTGALDDVVKNAIKKVVDRRGKTAAGKATINALLQGAASFGGEFVEEFVSSLVSPLVERIYNDETLEQYGTWDFWKEAVYEGLTGGLVGLIAGGAEQVSEYEKNKTGYSSVERLLSGDGTLEDIRNVAESKAATRQFERSTGTEVKTAADIFNTVEKMATEKYAAQQQNTASVSEAAESTAVNTDPTAHTPAEQAVIDQYQSAVDENLVNFVETSVANKGANKGRYTLGLVSERAAGDIKTLTGVDTTGFKTVIEQRIAEHIVDEHGPNGTTDQSMSDLNDIGRIQYVLDNYDTAEHGGRSSAYSTVKPNGHNGQAQTVLFSKAVNGTYYVVEAVPDTKAKTAFIVTAYMTHGKSKAEVSRPADASTPAIRPITSRQNVANATTSADSTISQAAPNVNAQEMPNSGTLPAGVGAVSEGQVSEYGANKLRYEASATAPASQLVSPDNLTRYAAEIDGVFDGTTPQWSIIEMGDTPNLLLSLGASSHKITLTQDTARKIAYPSGYMGGKHNLGIPALKQLPQAINNPAAVLRSKTQPNSFVLLTDWLDTNGNRVIIPIHLDKQGEITLENRVASAYGKGNLDAIITGADVLYTKNNEDIYNLRAGGLQLPASPETDVLVTGTISENGRNVNTRETSNSGALPEGMGAASAGFADSAYNRWVNDAGEFHQEGENAVRNPSMPTTDPEGRSTMKSAQTVMEAKQTPEERIPSIQDAAAEGRVSYDSVTNEELAARAEAKLAQNGWDKSLDDWRRAVYAGKVSDELVAMGAVLLNNAGNSSMSGAEYIDLMVDYSTLLNKAGKAVQAARILKRLTPEGRLYGIQKTLERLVDEYGGKYEFTLDEALAEKYRAADSDKARDAVIDEIQQSIADQIPSTLLDKWTALRYVNMLGNFKTQVRNVLGNVAMGGTTRIKDKVAAAIELGAYAVSGGNFERTKSLVVPRDLKKAARADFANVEKLALGEAKYQDGSLNANLRGIEEKRTIFKNNGAWGANEDSNAAARAARKAADIGWKAMEAYRKVTNWAMEKGDVIFSREAYASALAGWLKAHKITAEQWSNGKVDADTADRARAYAIQEAQEATFRDNNAFSNWVSKVGRRENTPKAVKVLSEGIMPFRKTPANILVRAEEYSPLGIINTAVNAVKAAKGADGVTGNDIINSAAKTLTGTGIVALGYMLRSLGHLHGNSDEPEDKLQDYSLVLPDGTSYTIDWLSPVSMPLFMGVQLCDMLADDGFQWSDMEGALSSIADPMIQMSMLSGINDTLDNIRFSENNLIQTVVSGALGYLTQGLTNTFIGQIESASEKYRQTTTVDKDSNLPSYIQRAIGKASAKIPGVDYAQADYIDVWGRREENPTGAMNFLETFLSPGYVSGSDDDPVVRETNRLYAAGYPSAKPQKPSQSFTYSENGQSVKVSLNAREYQDYQETIGATRYELTNALMNTEAFSRLSDEQKADVLSKIYSYAEAAAKAGISGFQPENWVTEVSGMDAEDAVNYLTVNEVYADVNAAVKAGEEADFDLIDVLTDYWVGNENRAAMTEVWAGTLDKLVSAAEVDIGAEQWYEVRDKYDEIDETDQKADQKEAAFNHWLESVGWLTSKQADLLDGQFSYGTYLSANPQKYNELLEAGFSEEKAYSVYDTVSGLTPSAGKSEVSNLQKYNAIIGVSGLSEQERQKALSEYSGYSEGDKDKFATAYKYNIPMQTVVAAYQWIDAYKTANDKSSLSAEAAQRMAQDLTRDKTIQGILYAIFGPSNTKTLWNGYAPDSFDGWVYAGNPQG